MRTASAKAGPDGGRAEGVPRCSWQASLWRVRSSALGRDRDVLDRYNSGRQTPTSIRDRERG